MKNTGNNICLLVVLLAVGSFFSCNKVEEPDYREKDYGYVQFKLYKKASYQLKSGMQMEYLHDISKVCVTLISQDGYEFSQTLVMNYSSEEAAEFGMRSDKLKLLTGTYVVDQYDLYDKQDVLVATTVDGTSEVNIVPGGLTVHDLLADVVERGSVRFSLVKDLTDVQTRTTTVKQKYTLNEIGYVTFALKNSELKFEMLPVKYSIDFDEDRKPDEDKDKGWQTSLLKCDTLLYLRAGKHEVGSYTIYDKSKKELEINDDVAKTFEVYDNKTTEVEVSIKLHKDAYISDYKALKKIYEALDGTNWYYRGDEWPVGSKWNFDKDIDLWGNQPGVKLHEDGRVALLSLSGFGAKGDIPEELGDLTALVELYIGNHNETNLLDYDPTVLPGMSSSNRMERHKEYLKMTKTLTQFSEPIARGMKEKNRSIPEIALYETMSEKDILDNRGSMRIRPMADVLPGVKTNGITSLPSSIGNLKRLTSLFIANGEISSLPEDLSGCEELTDLEIYNCQEMKEFPLVITTLPKLTSLNLSANPQWDTLNVNTGLDSLARSEAGKSIQILYMNECSLSRLPGTINNMLNLGLFSVASNKIEKIDGAFPDVSFVQLYLDNNLIPEIPHEERDGKRVFFRIADMETFSCTYNKLKKFPDIFDAEAVYGIASVDFSHNEIEVFENSEDDLDKEDKEDKVYQGIFATTLTLSNNPNLSKYPKCLATSKSKVNNLNLRGCGITTIPPGSFKGEMVKELYSLDLSYNKLKDFPREFTAVACPYFNGIDLSYNMLSEFPYEPLDCASLTVLAVRGQRNDDGVRCLTEWPQGVYNHTGLRALYLGSNDLGKINDTISYLIYMLDISDNPNIVFDASDICSSWAAGTYMLFYDKTQKILNCDAMLQ